MCRRPAGPVALADRGQSAARPALGDWCALTPLGVAVPANPTERFLSRAAHDLAPGGAYSPPMPPTARTAVVAVGGNALLDGGGPATIAEQFAAARRLAPQLCRLVADGWRIVLTHGNGPQVGFIMRRSDLVADIEPGLPQLALDMAVAHSQGSPRHIPRATPPGEPAAPGPPPPG